MHHSRRSRILYQLALGVGLVALLVAANCGPCTRLTTCASDEDCPERYRCDTLRHFCTPLSAVLTAGQGVLTRIVDCQPGDDFVLRALAHGNNGGVPVLSLLDVTEDRLLGQFKGRDDSSWARPDVLLLTAEAGAETTQVAVLLGNAGGRGEVSWHQVELLPNLITNPSFETAALDSTDPSPFEGWTVEDRDEPLLTVRQENTRTHSGRASAYIEGEFNGFKQLLQQPEGMENGEFYAMGGQFLWLEERSVGLSITNGSLFAQHRQLDHNSKLQARATQVTGTWQHVAAVGRQYRQMAGGEAYNNWNNIVRWGGVEFNGAVRSLVDDAYLIALESVNVEPLPAGEAASHTETQLRVDGADLAVQQAAFLPALTGKLGVNLQLGRPLGQALGTCQTPFVLMQLYADEQNLIELLATENDGLRLRALLGGVDHTLNSVANLGLRNGSHHVELVYTRTEVMARLDGMPVVTLSIGSSLASAPWSVSIGSDHERGQHCDLLVDGHGALLERLVVPAGVDGGMPGPDGGPTEPCVDADSTCQPALDLRQGMAVRPSPGPFDMAPIYQGDATRPEDETGDQLRYGFAPAQLAGRLERLGDVGQGTVVAWITPEWSAAEISGQLSFWTVAGISLGFNAAGDALEVLLPGDTLRFEGAAAWLAGQPHLVVLRWDRNRPLDGTHHVLLDVDDQSYAGAPGSFQDPLDTAGLIGARDQQGRGSANALIAGFTVYRRALFDGSRGIDLGLGNELERIRLGGGSHGGEPRDPASFTGSWDVVFALPTSQAAGRLRGLEHHAWTHPHAGNLLGAQGFMVGIAGDPAPGWQLGDAGGVELVATPAAERIFGAGVTVRLVGGSGL